jgi:UDP-N-acetylmuramate dehydrogenase
MNILKGVSLADYSTMGLGGKASNLAVVESRQDLIEALNFADFSRLKILMIGGGSNIVWQDSGYDGLVLVNRMRGFEVESEDEQGADILIGAGENWDLVVDRAVSLGLSGIECLSLIPGTAGATPVQNVGAYGQEISETLISVDGYDLKSKNFLTMLNSDCDFSYRNSCFKKEPGRYLILAIRLHLSKTQLIRPLYKAVEQYLDEHGIEDSSPKIIRQAVTSIRQHKLPNPAKIKNCGSFFKNPIVSKDLLQSIKQDYPEIPYWSVNANEVKLSAAWLLELCGFKNYEDRQTGMATWPNQPLVIVNQSASSTSDLIIFRDKIVKTVEQKFSISLVQEPQLLP